MAQSGISVSFLLLMYYWCENDWFICYPVGEGSNFCGILSTQPLHLHQAALYLLYQGRIFFKIWLPSFTLKLCVLWKAGKKLLWVKPKRGIKHHEGSMSKTTMKGQSQLASKLWPDLDSACLKAPVTTFCLTISMDLNFPQIFWFYLLSYLPLLHEATAVGFWHLAYTSLFFITRDGDISGIAHL